MTIHPTAIISEKATIGQNVKIGPYSWIQENVTIGNGCEIGAHVVIAPATTIGKDCKIYHSASIGEVPQDLKFHGEITSTEIGDRTVIREFVTIHRGTEDRWKTVVGSDCLLMAYAHVAHDCIIGNHCILANAVTAAGHVVIDDWAIIGGMVGIHQFVKIGCHAIVGGGWRTPKDVPPYIMAAGDPLRYTGINLVGLKRRGFSKESLKVIKIIYNLIYRSKFNVSDAVAEIKNTVESTDEVKTILDFIENSNRGIIR